MNCSEGGSDQYWGVKAAPKLENHFYREGTNIPGIESGVKRPLRGQVGIGCHIQRKQSMVPTNEQYVISVVDTGVGCTLLYGNSDKFQGLMLFIVIMGEEYTGEDLSGD